MAEQDISKISFQCPSALGTYEGTIIPFGLKNVGVTYQKEIDSFFHDLIGDYMQIYIDDVLLLNHNWKRIIWLIWEHHLKEWESMDWKRIISLGVFVGELF